MNIRLLSPRYEVKKLTDGDIPAEHALCRGNPLFYRHCPPMVTCESIRADMAKLPPGTTAEDKHYLGFFNGKKLIAVLDLIERYPNPETAFIGFL